MTAPHLDPERTPGGPMAAETTDEEMVALTAHDVVEQANQLITALESHDDPAVRHQLHALLQRIDVIHREALTRLMDQIHAMAGAAFVNKLTADPAIRVLLQSYDLVAVDRRLLADEALDGPRALLAEHGASVEVTEVVGGVVYAVLHGMARSGLDDGEVRDLLEAALAEHLIGFQQLELGPRPKGGPPPTVQLGRRVKRKPVYVSALPETQLREGETRAVEIGERSLLIARVAGEVYAIENRCGTSPLPLHYSALVGHEVVCSWHRCRYDVRTGERTDRPEDGDRVQVFPVRVHEGNIEIAVDTEPA